MLMWAIIFLVIALITGALGLPAVAAISAGISRILFFVFLVLFIIALVIGLGIFA